MKARICLPVIRFTEAQHLTPGSMTTPSIGLKTVPISSQPSVREQGANLSANFGYSDGHMELTATVDNATANQYDLVYGEATKTTSEDLSSVSTVAFNLGSYLSKIRILSRKIIISVRKHSL